MLKVGRLSFKFGKKVRVEYCMAWKYDTDFDKLKDLIHQKDKSIPVKGIKTQISNFYLKQEPENFKYSFGRMIKQIHNSFIVASKMEQYQINPSRRCFASSHNKQKNEWLDARANEKLFSNNWNSFDQFSWPSFQL